MSLLRRLRATAQLLHRPGVFTPVEIVRHLLAVQAQDLRSARLAIRARSRGIKASDVNAALDEGELVVAWLLRGTLHLVTREDYWWLHALTAPTRAAANRRRLKEEGVSATDADRAVGIIGDALAGYGPLARDELAEIVGRQGIRTAGQAMPHLLMLSVLRGVTVMGPVRTDGTLAYVLAHDWLGPPRRIDPEAGLRELGRRYVAAHAHATEEDLAHWAGITLTDARTAFKAAAMTNPHEDLEAAPLEERLLPAFDPYLLGWRDRSFAVPPPLAKDVHPGGGVIRPSATRDGEVVATWALRRGEVHAPHGFTAEAADVRRFNLG